MTFKRKVNIQLIIVLALAVAMLIIGLTSCTKDQPPGQSKTWYYKIQEVDLDGNVSSTPVYHAVARTLQASPAALDDHGGHDKEYCKHHPHDPSCVCTPVLYANIKIYRDGKHWVITWDAPIEYNVKEYDILRSSDGKVFARIGQVSPTGEGSHYKFTD